MRFWKLFLLFCLKWRFFLLKEHFKQIKAVSWCKGIIFCWKNRLLNRSFHLKCLFLQPLFLEFSKRDDFGKEKADILSSGSGIHRNPPCFAQACSSSGYLFERQGDGGIEGVLWPFWNQRALLDLQRSYDGAHTCPAWRLTSDLVLICCQRPVRMEPLSWLP